MHSSKYFLRNINLINIILIAVLAAFIIYPKTSLFNAGDRYPSSEGEIFSDSINGGEGPPVVSAAPRTGERDVSSSDYVIIAERNLFHPERKRITNSRGVSSDKGHDFLLYGTLITDEMSVAYLENRKSPVATPGRGNRQTALKLGESLDGFTLKEVYADKVVMLRGEERVVVLLNDPERPKKRGQQKQASQKPKVAATAQQPTPGGFIVSNPPKTRESVIKSIDQRRREWDSKGFKRQNSRPDLYNKKQKGGCLLGLC
jgi:hypothetical protein